MNHYFSAIDLNHAAPTRATGWMTLLLLLGALSCGCVFFYAQSLTADQTSLRQQIARLTASGTNPTTSNDWSLGQTILAKRNKKTGQTAEATQAKAAIQEIVTPWLSLFRSLEKANIESVKLLKVEPNAKQRNVRISAIAADVDDMLAYIDNLNRQSVIRQAELTAHEAIEINGQAAVEFQVSALWTL